MKISKIARRDAKQLFRACQVDGLLDEDRVRRAAAALVEKKPRGYAAILDHLHRLVHLDVASRTARIQSAVALDEAAQRAVRQNLAGRYGNGIQVVFEVNPGLLGGLRIQVGSDVFDGSVRSRLNRLQESFQAGAAPAAVSD